MATERSKKAKALQDKSKDFVMLAHSFSPDKHIFTTPSKKNQFNIKDWYVTEKIDGVRAVYRNGKLYTRNKNEIYAPKEFIDIIKYANSKCNLELDGELVHKQGFQKTVSIVKDQTNKVNWTFWKNIQYIIFDYKTSNNHSYDIRISTIEDILRLLNQDNISLLLPSVRAKSNSNLFKELKKVEQKGGEGLILRNPDGLYKCGRSWDLLKLKSFIDCEATVLSHVKGEGKHSDRLGKLVCQLNNGIKFECGTGFSDEERENPPSIGSRITIRYFDLTDDGLPRFPVYVSKRDYE